MSAQLMSLALSMPSLKPTEKLVLVKLCDHANESGEAWPLKKNLAETLGIDRKSVYRAYDRLLELGLLKEIGNNGVAIDLNIEPWWYSEAEVLFERIPLLSSERFAVFSRDNFTCVYCGDKPEDIEIDHILPVSKGGDNSLSNLNSCCPKCNRLKGSKTLEEWGKII